MEKMLIGNMQVLDRNTAQLEPATLNENPFSANGNRPSGELQRAHSRSWLFNHRWLASLVIVAVFVGLSFWLVGLPRFETNDDFAMMSIVSGSLFVDKPDEHILYSHVFLGMLLKQLYSAAPHGPWYGIWEVSATVIPMIVIAWLTLGKSRRPAMMTGLAFAALLITCVRPLELLQFTTTSALLACAGVLLMMECVESWHRRKHALACAFGAILMIALSALVRECSTTLVLLVASMFVVSRFLPTLVRQWRKMCAQLLAAGMACALVLLFNWVNDNYYQKEWKDFYPITSLTSSIREHRCDYRDSELSRLMYKHIGWTEADAKLFFNWYILDENTYSLQKLQTLAKLKKEWWKQNFEPERAMQAVQTIVGDPTFLKLLLPCLFLVPLVNRKKVPLVSVVLFSIGILSFFVFSILWLKLPMRVFASVALASTLFGIRYVSMEKISNIFEGKPTTRNIFHRTIYATILLATVAPGFYLMSQVKAQLESICNVEKKATKDLQTLAPKADQLYVTWAGSLPPSSPFTDMKKEFANFKILPVGASGRAPFVANRMKEFGIKDPLRQLDKANVYLIADPHWKSVIEQHSRENFKQEYVFTPVAVDSQIVHAYKVRCVSPTK